MTTTTASVYQRTRWLDLVAAAVDHAQPVVGATPSGAPQAVAVTRSGLYLSNATPVAVTDPLVTAVRFLAGTTVLYTVPFTQGRSAYANELAYTFDAP